MKPRTARKSKQRPAVGRSKVRKETHRTANPDLINLKAGEFFEIVPDAIVVVDRDGRVLFVNSHTEKLFGYSREELINGPVEILLPERFKDLHVEHRASYDSNPYPRYLRSGLDLFGRRKDGTEFPVEISLSPMDTEGGFQVSAVVRDVTDRRRAERELQRREEQLRMITDSLPVLIAEVGSDHRYRFANKAHEEWFHIVCERIAGRHLQEVLGEDFYKGIRPYVEQALAGQKVSFESDILDRNGTEHRIWVLFLPHRGEDQEVKGFFSLVNDISERARAEQGVRKLNEELERRVAERMAELQEEKDRTKEYLDVAGVIIVVIDEDEKVVLINKKGCEVLGYEEVDIVGKNWFDSFLPERIREEVRIAFHEIMRGEVKPLENYENPVLTGSGEERIIFWHNTVLRDQNGKICSSLSSGLDITEKLLLEEQVRRADRLAAVGQLTTGLAHEIGTPLNIIAGRAEFMLRRMSPGDPLCENLERIIAQIERIAKLVRQLLDFARPKPPEVRPFRLARLLKAVLPLFEHQMAQQGVRTALHVLEDLPEIEADPDQIQQVIFNIILNAMQAMPRGGDLTLRAAQTIPRRGREDRVRDGFVKIQVSDTGGGIPPEILPKIFDPFFSTKEEGKGAGLGLAVSYGIVRKHGGWIDVKSRVGEGSIFSIYLPLGVNREGRREQVGDLVHG